MSGSRANQRKEGERGDHKNTLKFVGRVSGQVWLYRESESGGGGSDEQIRIKPRSLARNSNIIWGVSVSYQGTPPPPILPINISRTCQAGKTQAPGRWEVSQRRQGIRRKSVRKAEIRAAGDHRR